MMQSSRSFWPLKLKIWLPDSSELLRKVTFLSSWQKYLRSRASMGIKSSYGKTFSLFSTNSSISNPHTALYPVKEFSCEWFNEWMNLFWHCNQLYNAIAFQQNSSTRKHTETWVRQQWDARIRRLWDCHMHTLPYNAGTDTRTVFWNNLLIHQECKIISTILSYSIN